MLNSDKLIDYYLVSAYIDYTSSRFLLLNDHHLNGIIIAATAVEKYLKACFIDITGDQKKFHLNQKDIVKKIFLSQPHLADLIKYPDQVFLGILSKSYSYRYLDNFGDIDNDCLGFLANHILAQLDDYILYLDKNVNRETPLKRAITNKDEKIFLSNYVLNNESKKDFYEKESKVFAMQLIPNNGTIYGIKGTAKVRYNGKMTLIFLGEQLPEENIKSIIF